MRCLLACLLSLLLPAVAHTEALDVDDGYSFAADPWAYLEILPNAPGDATAAQIQGVADHAFVRPGGATGPLRIPAGQYPAWLRLRLHNPQAHAIDLVWEFRVQSIRQLDFHYREQGAWRRIAAGSRLPFGERDVPVFSHVFRWSLPPGTHTVFVQADAERSVHVRTTLYNDASYLLASHWNNWFSGILRGISIGLLCFTLLLYLRTRDVVYVAFSALILLNMAYRGYYEGFAQWLLPSAVAWNGVAFGVCFHLYLAAAAWFHDRFLDLARDAPRLHRVNVLIMITFTLAGLASLAYAAEVRSLLAPATVVAPVYFLGAALWRLRAGYGPAGTFLLALALPLCTGTLAAAGGAGLIPLPESFRDFDRSAGAMGLILFALAVADRIKLLEEDKRVAERDAVAAQAQARAKSEFLAKMSHEIRTPMNGVLGMIQLLRDSPLDEAQARHAAVIHKSSNALLHIINDLLDFSKAEAGKLELEQTPFDLREVCDDALALFRTAGSGKPLSLDCRIDDDVPDAVLGDPNRLRQVLINLLGNAHKFTHEGSIRLSVSVGDAPDLLRLSVADSGIGISAAEQQRLFEAFAQASAETAGQYGGTGLGLSICKELVQLMDGEIWVESTPGQGSTFSFTARLPACAPALRQGERAAGDTPGAAPEQRQLTVLVADDNAVNRQVVEAMIGRLGHEAILVNDGEQALEAVRSAHERFDLVLMDCEMPVMDGFRATRHIREWERAQSLPALPVLALTAHASSELEARCRSVGMQAVVSKPLRMEALAGALAEQAPTRR